MLDEFVVLNREEIIKRCRAKVAKRWNSPPSETATDHGVPLFLDQLVDTLRGPGSSPEICSGAVLHGHESRLQGVTVSQLVHDYGDVCQSITELAMETEAPISAAEFHTLNRCLDDAIASAVTEFGRERHHPLGDGEASHETVALGFIAHELRNLTQTALVAFEILKTGNVGVAGSTGAVLHRSLIGLTALFRRALAEVRLSSGIQNRERFLVSGFIDELAANATLEANARRVTLAVLPVEDGVTIEADRQVLAAVVGNLLQNAFKFTRPATTVTLRVGTSAERVMIEIEDECGGLPAENGKDLFRPFEQRSADRTGLGLGLAFSRWAAEANDGRISTRTLPGKGCVFALDLPRVHVPAVA